MPNRKTAIMLIVTLVFLSACGKNTNLNPEDNDLTAITFGTSNTLDIVTWNLKTFPEVTDLSSLTQMIPAINADVIAFQEIMDYNAFMDMAAEIPNYAACVYTATDTYRLAYLYDTRTVTVNENILSTKMTVILFPVRRIC